MDATFNHVLVATDGSTRSDPAIELALRAAGGAPLTAVLVVCAYGLLEFARATFCEGGTIDHLQEQLLTKGRDELDAALKRCCGPDHSPSIRPLVVLAEQASCAILQTADREGCDLIVMASHGRGSLASVLLGSQTAKVLSQSRVPVLIARAGPVITDGIQA